jgi:hypothetical protein
MSDTPEPALERVSVISYTARWGAKVAAEAALAASAETANAQPCAIDTERRADTDRSS